MLRRQPKGGEDGRDLEQTISENGGDNNKPYINVTYKF